jgi:hypothetical protein
LKKRTRRQLQGWGAVVAVATAVWVARHWSVVWPVLVTVLAAAVTAGAAWALLRAHRRAVGQDRIWRAQHAAAGTYGCLAGDNRTVSSAPVHRPSGLRGWQLASFGSAEGE